MCRWACGVGRAGGLRLQGSPPPAFPGGEQSRWKAFYGFLLQ